MKELTFTLENIQEAAQLIIENANHKVVCLYGEMGAGKTTLIRAIISLLGSENQVSSPTFGFVNEYAISNNEDPIFHFDLYRLENEMEALDFGIEEYLYANNWVFIEWPEKIQGILPEHHTEVILESKDLITRELKLKNKSN